MAYYCFYNKTNEERWTLTYNAAVGWTYYHTSETCTRRYTRELALQQSGIPDLVHYELPTPEMIPVCSKCVFMTHRTPELAVYFYKCHMNNDVTYQHIMVCQDGKATYYANRDIEFLKSLVPDLDTTTYFMVNIYEKAPTRVYLKPLGDPIIMEAARRYGSLSAYTGDGDIYTEYEGYKVYKCVKNPMFYDLYIPWDLVLELRQRYARYIDEVVVPMYNKYIGKKYHICITVDGPEYDHELEVGSNIVKFLDQYDEILEHYDVVVTGVKSTDDMNVLLTIDTEASEEPGDYIASPYTMIAEKGDITYLRATSLADDGLQCGGYSFAIFPREEWDQAILKHIKV